MSEKRGKPQGVFRRLWNSLTRPSVKYATGTLLGIGIIAGALGWQGFNSVVAYTNTLDFCTSCHEMEAYVYPEYAESSHYSNASGVQVTCADCHVPRAFFPKMVTKVRASMVELPSHFMGKLDTEEKFEAHKLELAERVWARMEGNDSRECRECHSWEAMSETAQPTRAWREHVEGRAAGETCVNCHKGVAHSLPAEYLEVDDDDLDFDF